MQSMEYFEYLKRIKTIEHEFNERVHTYTCDEGSESSNSR